MERWKLPNWSVKAVRITIFGETLDDWKEMLQEAAGWLFLRALRIAFYLAILYGLVKFVKWAWFN